MESQRKFVSSMSNVVNLDEQILIIHNFIPYIPRFFSEIEWKRFENMQKDTRLVFVEKTYLDREKSYSTIYGNNSVTT